jgi:DNA-binding transcriptional LysR family regulator
MLKRFTMAELGVGFVAGSHCREEVAAGRLVARPLGPEPMARQIGLIYRKDKALSKAALGFIEVTMSHAVTEAAAAPKRTGAAERTTARAISLEH